MGRYYKPANPANIGYAFQAPVQEFSRAINKVDQGVDTYLSSVNQLKGIIDARKAASGSGVGQGMYLPNDEQSYVGEVNKLESGINQVTNNILKDPLNYGSQTYAINNLRRQINTSLTSGSMYWFNKNYNTVKEWLKTNKKIDPTDLNAVYEHSLSKWKGTIGPDGEYRDISKYLPTTVYGTDVNKEAINLASKTDKQANLQYRAGLIYNSLASNSDAYNSEYQRLNTGLYTQKVGKKDEAIDPSKLNEVQKNNLVQNRLKKYAYDAALLTQDTTKGTGSTKASNLPATNIQAGIDEISAKPDSPILTAADFSANEGIPLSTGYQQMLEHYNNVIQDANNGLTKTFARINKQILTNQMEKLSKNVGQNRNDNAFGYSTPGMQRQAVQQVFDENFNSPVTKVFQPGWNNYNLTVGQKKKIVDGIKNEFYDLGNLKNKTILSPIKDFNGKTLAEIEKDPNILQRTVANTAQANQTASKMSLEPEYKDTYSGIIPEQKGNKWEFVGTNAKTQKQEVIKDSSGDPVTMDVSYGNRYNNFSVNTNKKPDITNLVDDHGNPYIRIPIKYNGSDSHIYVSAGDVNPQTGQYTNSVANQLYSADPSAIYSNLAKKLYSTVSESGVGVYINPNMSFAKKDNKIVLMVGNNAVEDPDQIEKYLTLYLKTVNGNSVTK